MARPPLPLASVPLLLAAGGCLSSPVGDYRVDESGRLVATCTGVDTERAALWAEAMEAGIADLAVAAAGEEGGTLQVQATRGDSTVVLGEAEDGGGASWDFQRELRGTTVAGADLGSDFAALLQPADIGCTFDLSETVSMDWEGEDEWKTASGRIVVDITEGEEPEGGCGVERCTAEWNYEATHQGGADPGRWGG